MSDERLLRQLEKVASHLQLVMSDVAEIVDQLRHSLTQERTRTTGQNQPTEPGTELDIRPRPVRSLKYYGISVRALVDAGFLQPRDRLETRRDDQTEYATITRTGRINWRGEEFDSPSTAAGQASLYMGGPKTRNGWDKWALVKDGRTLSEVRQEFIDNR